MILTPILPKINFLGQKSPWILSMSPYFSILEMRQKLVSWTTVHYKSWISGNLILKGKRIALNAVAIEKSSLLLKNEMTTSLVLKSLLYFLHHYFLNQMMHDSIFCLLRSSRIWREGLRKELRDSSAGHWPGKDEMGSPSLTPSKAKDKCAHTIVKVGGRLIHLSYFCSTL